jgi:hypothetical protein
MDHRDQIDELLQRANGMGHGKAQYALCDEAVRLADAHQDVEAGFHARQEYVKATMFSGQPDKMLVAFTWCLAQVDRDPERFDLYRLLWQYKWVVNALPDFPTITRRQIEEMFADMERRFLAFGATPQAVWNKRRSAAMKMGEPDAARRAQDQLSRLRRDPLSDCLACEMDEFVKYNQFVGDDGRAVAEAAPILRGRFSCSEVPQVTYAQVLLPLIRTWRAAEAMPHHLQGYRMISRNPAEFIPQIGEHITFLALTGNFARGLRLMEKHLALALETCCPAWAFEVFLALKLLLESLKEARLMTLRFRRPESFPARSASSEYDLVTLLGWFTERCAELAAQFDARNGNDYHRRRVADGEQLKRYATVVKLPTTSE